MKTIAVASPIIASDNMQSSVMGMDAQGMNTATYFLRDKIYSDKIGAVVREYACNALDEHKKYSIDREVDIGIRMHDQAYEFYCRDYAKGLSEDGVRNIFGMYFRSTKSTTNESIGGFGIGSKAGHCYGDTFFVTSYHDGIKATYTCMLGGGDNGVPVGHIYKVDEQPTTETGLEVSLPLQNNDVYAFRKAINSFVTYSSGRICSYSSPNDPIRPLESVLQKTIDGINFRLVKVEDSNTADVHIQMGGVTYDYTYVDLSGYCVKHGHRLIADLPIGSMSIPISRESFEKTASNKKMLEKLQKILQDWCIEDTKQFKDKNILQLMQDMIAGLGSETYVGEVFSVGKSTLYKSVWPLVGQISHINKEEIALEKRNGKPVLLLIPSQSISSRYWRDKISVYCGKFDKNYYIAQESAFNRVDANEIAEHLFVQNLRKFPFPKIARDTQTYAMYGPNSDIGRFNALDFHNYAIQRFDLPKVESIDEAKKQMPELIKKVDLGELRYLTLANRNSGKRDRDVYYYANSDKILDQLEKIGWLRYNSAAYKSAVTEKTERAEKKYELQSKLSTCKLNFALLNPATLDRLEKDVRHLDKFYKIINGISTEKTLRGKLWRRLAGSYYSHENKLSRQELRSLLRMK